MNVLGNDTCNVSTGSVTLSESTVTASNVVSTLVGCTTPTVTAIGRGTSLQIDGSELIVGNPDDSLAPSTRYLAWESMTKETVDGIEGTYLYATTVVRIADATIEVGGCRASWSENAGLIDIDVDECTPPPGVEWWTGVDTWDELRTTTDGDLIVLAGDELVRLEHVEPGTMPQPTLAAFLGVVAGRTWVLDDPSGAYPSPQRPFIRFALHGAADSVPAAFGFDGCTRFAVRDSVHDAGVWTPVDGGWAFAPPLGIREPVDDCADLSYVRLVEATYRVTSGGLLEVVQADGERHTMQDAARRPSGITTAPTEEIGGAWTLAPDGASVEITVDPATFRIGDCTTAWKAYGQWVELEPASCTSSGTDAAVERFVQLIRDGATLTVGLTEDLNTLYLSADLTIDTPDTAVFRLTRAPR